MFDSACGLHINALVTETALYIPTFGTDPENQELGQSAALDASVLQQFQNETPKPVIGVPVPYNVCKMGGNIRCLSWQTKSQLADDLVLKARQGGCYAIGQQLENAT